jgi:hypothetical protein
MKKMIVIAALMGAMFMPAQIMAKENRANNRPNVEYRNNRKDKKEFKKKYNRKVAYKYDNKFDKRFDKKFEKRNNKYNKRYYKKNKPAVVVVNRPGRPVPPPPPVKVVYRNNAPCAAGVVAGAIGLAALAAIIAN